MSKASARGTSIVCNGPSGNYSTYANDRLQVSVTQIGSRVTGSFITGKVRAPRATAAR